MVWIPVINVRFACVLSAIIYHAKAQRRRKEDAKKAQRRRKEDAGKTQDRRSSKKFAHHNRGVPGTMGF
jgi:hypothetical protein